MEEIENQIDNSTENNDFLEGLGVTEVKEEEVEETTETEPAETEETTEQVDELEETKEEQKEEPLNIGDIEVKYLHESKKLSDLTPDEIKTFVQKGMNHDRISEKLASVNEKLDMFKEIAELHGMDDSQLLDALFEQYFSTVADRDGIEPIQAKQKYEQSKQARTQKMLDKFITEFKEVKPEDIPQEVWDSVKNGSDLTSAYKEHLSQTTLKTKDSEMAELKSKIEALEKQLKVKEQNESTKKKAVVKQVNSLEENEDDFLSGLFG